MLIKTNFSHKTIKMSIDNLEAIAESLRGQNVIVNTKAGDHFPGLLSSVRTNTSSLEKSIELTDQNGKGALISLKIIESIDEAE
ncbi:hypothetical protein SAMN05443550_12010 [Pedobacter hartonius]|uniref:Uncharacterized protein n=2 Tax=Pedobacter hartonius TaxID=425514 RepID=A0A1H4HI23_9SPHI|nr:hypothetical protein SAMN05443550_12010 [Pedobacter hartonius]